MNNVLLGRLKLSRDFFYTLFAVALTLLTVVFSLLLVSVNLKDAGHDSQWYIRMAEGRVSETIEPYSGRFLYPFLAGWLDKSFPLDIGQSFFLLATISLFFFLITNFHIFKKTVELPFLIIPLFFLPSIIWISREIFLPDIFYFFLTALFFLFLFRKMEAMSLVALFLLFLTRESTALLGLIFIIFSWFRSKRALSLVAVVVMLISLYTTGFISDMGEPNVHGLGSFAYLPLKLFYNFSANALGIKLWVNTYAFCEPTIRMALPHLGFLGDIREVGVCGFYPSLPLDTFLALITVFGVAPLVFFYVFFKKIKFILREAPFWLSLAAIYGAAHYFVGIPAGTSVGRIVGYGWPALLLALPLLTKNYFDTDRNFIIKLSLVQFLVAWLPFVIQVIAGYSLAIALFVIQGATGYSLSVALLTALLITPFYVWVFSLLRGQKLADPASLHDKK